MFWIGVTGPMGSGKSTVAKLLREMGHPVLDADATVAQVLGPGQPALAEIASVFGASIVAADQTLNRRALAAEVFGDPEKLARLEAIIHPRVRDRVAAARARLAREGRAAAFYDVPLLFEKKMEAQFDHVLVVSAAREIRLARAMARTGLSAAEIEARWAHQLAPEYKERRASAVIKNDGDEVELRAHVRAALDRLGVPDAGTGG